MNRTVGEHQSGVGEAEASENSAKNTEEYFPEYIAVTAFESSHILPTPTTETDLSEADKSNGAKGANEVSFDKYSFEVDNNDGMTNKSSKRKSERKSKSGKFGYFLIRYAVVFLACIVIGLICFWKYIAAYESSRPEHTMDSLIQTMDKDSGTDALKENFKVSEFEDKDKVFKEIYSSYLQGQSCSYRKMPGEYTDDTPVYIIRSGTVDLLKVSLEPKGKNAAGFGFQLWKVSSMGLLNDKTRPLTIEAPPNAAVSINGIAVSKDYITDNHVEYRNLTAQEKRFNNAYRVLYSVNGLYDEAKVSALDEQGSELTNENAAGGKLVFDSKRYSVKVTAPSNAIITLNGIELGKGDVTGTLFSSKQFNGLKKYVDSVPDIVTYEIDGFKTAPEIAAKDASGQKLTSREDADGGTVFGFQSNEKLKNEHTQLVTDFIKDYVSFSTNKGNNTGSNFSRLSKVLLPGTETYNRIKNSIDGISWVSGHIVEYRVLTADDFIACGENCFACHVSLGLSMTSNGNTQDTDSSYNLVLVRSGGVWLVGNMSVA